MTTYIDFSALVDDVIAITGRIDMIPRIVAYANLTVRECQSKADWYKDLIEDATAATASPHIMTIPPFFSKMRTVYYPSLCHWPNFRPPGKITKDEIWYYYAASTYFVFAGVNVGDKIDFAWFRLLPPLSYGKLDTDTIVQKAAYPVRAARLDSDAIADGTAPWVYWDVNTLSWVPTLGGTPDPITGVTDLDLAAQLKVSHWLLTDWSSLIKEGTMAKMYKTVNDKDRAVASYSLYKSLQNDLLANELRETLGA